MPRGSGSHWRWLLQSTRSRSWMSGAQRRLPVKLMALGGVGWGVQCSKVSEREREETLGKILIALFHFYRLGACPWTHTNQHAHVQTSAHTYSLHGAVKLVLWRHWMHVNSGASSDVREPISLHQAVHTQSCMHTCTCTHKTHTMRCARALFFLRTCLQDEGSDRIEKRPSALSSKLKLIFWPASVSVPSIVPTTVPNLEFSFTRGLLSGKLSCPLVDLKMVLIGASFTFWTTIEKSCSIWKATCEEKAL